MSGTPRINFAAGSRNDGHGGNLAHRMQVSTGQDVKHQSTKFPFSGKPRGMMES